MSLRVQYLVRFLFLFALVIIGQAVLSCYLREANSYNDERLSGHTLIDLHPKPKDSIEVKVSTFLGNEKRNYYGDSIPGGLDVIWKCFLGSGKTIVNDKKGVEEWFGAGWTGQPLVVKQNDKTWLIQGAFDHNLKKIDAATGEVEWNYAYDDIIKGTGTIWNDPNASDPQNRLVILQGSRKGLDVSMASPQANSYRAVSFFSGKELWRFNVKHTASYSRDVDASALLVGDTAYVGLENGKFISFDPGKNILNDDTVNRPVVFSEDQLYTEEDAAHHGGNLVTESSPARIGDHVYITAGSGHVYGYDLKTKQLDWDYFIGSDMDGTPVVTSDNCLLVAVEKQYIAGHGGIFKLDPKKTGDEAVVWYFPTGDLHFSSWEGGVIGSVAVNDAYNDGSAQRLAAFTGIDGYLNVVQYDRIEKDSMATGPDGKKKFPRPVLRYQAHIGSSISTPIFSKNRLIAAGYSGIHLFSYDGAGFFTPLDSHGGIFEASPVADNGRIYIASRDGYLYCFGDTVGVKRVVIAKEEPKVKPIPVVHPVVTPKTSSTGKYALVAGVFRQEANATQFVKTWRERNFPAEIRQQNGLFYVIVSMSSDVNELSAASADIQKRFGSDCWIKLLE